MSNKKVKKLKVNKIALAWIVKNAKPQAIAIVSLILIYAALAIIGVYTATLSKSVVNAAIGVNLDFNGTQGIIFYGSLFVGLLLLDVIFRIICKVLVFRINARLEITFKTNLFKNMIEKDYSHISAFHSGELLNRLTSDVTVITGTIVSILPNLAFFVVKLVGVFIVLYQIDARFTFVFFVGGAIALLVASMYKKKMKDLHKRSQETDGKTRSFLQETLSSLLVVKIFEAEQGVAENAIHLQEENFKVKSKRNTISIFSNTAFTFVFTAAYMYGLIWGAFNIHSGAIDYGTLTAILSLVGQIQSPIAGLTGIVPQYYAAIASAERIMEIENMPNEIEINDENIDTQKLYDNMSKIVFDEISFSYDRDIVLSNTSLSINKGEFVIITGISGIGKSTLIKLLMGVFPLDDGEIFFEQNDGERILIDKNIRKIFAYVPQGNFLLSGTIRENISFVRPDATDDEIMEAIKISCAEEFLSELPNGLDTKIGEKGQGLSEGQVQRIAIARAILAKSPILLLDESTSALDEKTEKQLLKNIKSMKKITCIIISHKKASMSVCDKEIRIQNKKIKVRDINAPTT